MMTLKYEDYKWKESGPFDREKLVLPKLLSSRLPDEILKKYHIPQVNIEELERKYRKKRKIECVEKSEALERVVQKRNTSNVSSNVGSPLNVVSGSGSGSSGSGTAPGSRPSSGKSTPATSVTSDSFTPPMNNSPPYIAPIKQEKTMKFNSDPQKLTDLGDFMKKKAINSYQGRIFDISILEFTQSYLIFILALRMKEKEHDIVEIKAANERAKYISRKRRDWNDVLSLGDKIIDNFGQIISNVDPKSKRYNYMNHMIGFVHYTNGFIQLHLSELFSQHIDILKSRNKTKENYDLTLQMIKLLEKEEEVRNRSKMSLQLGEDKFGIFVISKVYTNLWNRSVNKLSNIDHKEILVSGNIRMGKAIPKLKNGVNYCLPISAHLWDLDTVVNFGGFFFKEWCMQQNINHELVFE